MEVILLKEVENLGNKNSLVNVKNGYARNYLIPQGLAVLADEGRKKFIEKQMLQQVEAEEKLLKETESISEKLQKAKIKVAAKAGEKDKLFGSVTSIQLADAIEKQAKIKVDKKGISLLEEVKKLGKHKAKINLHKDVDVEITFDVVAEK